MTESWLCPNPECGYRARVGTPVEIPSDLERCPHCGTDGTAFVPLVLIASFPEPYLAHLVRSRLEADGIVATLSDEHLASVTSIAGDGGVKLRVRRDQVEAALAIMQGTAAESPDAGDDIEPDVVGGAPVGAVLACPRCAAATPTATERRGLRARLLGARQQCVRCGHTWRA